MAGFLEGHLDAGSPVALMDDVGVTPALGVPDVQDRPWVACGTGDAFKTVLGLFDALPTS